MDAKEYILIATRMCNTFYGKGCDKCQSGSKPFCVATMSNKIAEHVDEAIELVEQWGKDHPVKTRQSEFLKMFPNAPINRKDGILCIDPCAIDCTQKDNKKYCNMTCTACRKDYWNEEVSE